MDIINPRSPLAGIPSESPDCARATMVDVTDVPMLAPMTREMACLTVKRSAATMVMTIEVEVEDDWTSTVTSTPTSTAEGKNNNHQARASSAEGTGY